MKGVAENLRRAIENPVRIAIRYTKADTAVEITVRRRGTAPDSIAVIQVRDHGPGVPRKKVFLPCTESQMARQQMEQVLASQSQSVSSVCTEEAFELRMLQDGGFILEMELPLAG